MIDASSGAAASLDKAQVNLAEWSFPLDPRVPRKSMWYLKTKFLPWLYWSHMLRGGTIDIRHRERGW